jgi:hypothetical protein
MQSAYDAIFSREMGCTEAEWLSWLPAAIGAHAWYRDAAAAQVSLQEDGVNLGQLRINWQQAAPRVIAQVRIPCLKVIFCFEGLDAAQRYRFMRRFDLYMQRGGG